MCQIGKHGDSFRVPGLQSIFEINKKKKRGGGGSEIRTDPHWVCGESAQLLFFHLHSLQM